MACGALSPDRLDLPASNLSLVVDDQFNALAAWLDRRGKAGKPPTLPRAKFSNRLLLQLHALKEEKGQTWSDIEQLFDKLFPGDNFPPVVHLIKSAVKQFNCLKEPPQEFLESDRDIDFLGPFSKEAGVRRNSLLQNDLTFCAALPNGLVSEIINFGVMKRIKSDVTAKWISCLCGIDSSVPISAISAEVKKIKDKSAALRRRQSKPGGQDALKSFLHTSFKFSRSSCLPSTSPQFSRTESGLSKESSAHDSEFSSQPSVPLSVSQPSVPLPTSQLSVPLPTAQPSVPLPLSLPSVPLPSSQLSVPLPSSQLSVPLPTSQPSVPLPTGQPSALDISNSKIFAEMKKHECKIRQMSELVEETEKMNEFLHGLCKGKEKTISELKTQTNKIPGLEKKIEVLAEELLACKKNLTEKEREIRSLKKTSVRVRLVRRERELKKMKEQLQQISKSSFLSKSRSNSDKKKLHLVQRETSVLRRRLKDSVESNQSLRKQLKEANNQIQQNIHFVQATERNAPQLKESQKCVDNAVICTAQLVGECDVAAHSCGKVMQCVSRHIFGCDIPDNELPSTSSALRFADVGHVLAKMHAREEMTSKKFDLHCDGTSRNREKFIGQQITLADKSTLSLGYQTCAREDAQSVLNLTLHMFDELQCLDFDDRGEEQLKEMLRNLVGIMTDRANVMKSFQDAVEAKRKEILQSDDGITRLYCNAHFLLALSTAASKALSNVEETKKLGKLGRDNVPAFKRFFSNDPSAVRVIRLVCDVLGPRGDERNGCRDDWLAFCALQRKVSKVGSFRGNRFNNLFESAAALIHHHEDIVLFFSTYRKPANLKQQSIVHDMKSPEIMAMVASLAVTFIFLTGPFWQLIKSSTHYLDQGIHIQQMYSNILAAKDYPSTSEMLNRCPTALQGFGLPPSDVINSVYAYINTMPGSFAELTTFSVLSMMEEFAVKARLQLKQFLHGGIYSAPATPEQRQEMEHCKLNNLFGEACLGDLDFSLFKRRNSSVHHHSTVNMMKRNKPISKFLLKKPVPEQERLLSFARSKAPILRQEHRAQEKGVVEERQQYLQEQRTKEQRRQAVRERQRLHAVRGVQQQGGLCLDKDSVERLLRPLCTQTAKLQALSVQLRYHRAVLGSKSKLLNKTRLGVDEIKRNLIQYLETMDGKIDQQFQVPEDMRVCVDGIVGSSDYQTSSDSTQTRPTKRAKPKAARKRKHQDESDSEEAGLTDSGTDGDTDELDIGNGKFAQGQTIAVYYDNTFYVGEVLEIRDNEKALVNFMDQVSSKNIFIWKYNDTDEIDKRYVFMWDVKMSSNNGRTWFAVEYKKLVRLYKLFEQKYCI